MSQFVDNSVLKCVRDQAESLRGILADQKMQDHVDALDALISDIEGQRFAVGVVGMAKRGKSTLINALLGRSDDVVAPVDRFPATNVVTMFGYAAQEQAQVVFHDGRTQGISFQQIRQFACEDGNKGNVKGVKSIEVTGPFPGLHPGVFVVDTPGAGNAMCSIHEEILLNVLPRIDALLFLVTADDPIKQDELALLTRIRGHEVKKVIFVVNKADLCEKQELAEALEHNQRILARVGYGDVPIFEISAKKHWEGGADEGTLSLMNAVRMLITEERIAITKQRYSDRLTTIQKQIDDELKKRIEDAGLSEADREAEKREIQATKRKLASGKFQLESMFRSEWQDAIEKYERVLPRLRQETTQAYATLISKTSAAKIADISKIIHTDVVLKIQETVQPYAMELTRALSQAMIGLLQSSGQILVKTDINVGPPVATDMNMVADAAKIAVSAIPSLAVAGVAAALPAAIASMAPAAVALTWYNPLAWAAAGAAGVGGAATTAIATAVAPIATFLAPAAIAWAGYRAYSAWAATAQKNRNNLQIQVNKIIGECYEQILTTLSGLRRQESKITAAYFMAMEAKLQEAEDRLIALAANRIPRQQIIGWKDARANVMKCANADVDSAHKSSTPVLTNHFLG